MDITAPLYWWKEFDTYKIGTVANSTSTMHKIASQPITMECFEIDDYNPNLGMIDTLLAPFVKQDKLTYTEVKQSMQNFIFSVNSNSRAGAEPAFFNLTFDLTPPEDMLDDYCIIGGDLVSFTYRDCQQEIDLINRVFFEIMLEGDAEGKLFAYPIPTYNIHTRFNWDNPNNKLLWEMAGKYGTPYFANFINSELDISDVRSMCCRLRLDLSELRHRNGGLFGAGDSTGSIGVVTIS